LIDYKNQSKIINNNWSLHVLVMVLGLRHVSAKVTSGKKVLYKHPPQDDVKFFCIVEKFHYAKPCSGFYSPHPKRWEQKILSGL